MRKNSKPNNPKSNLDKINVKKCLSYVKRSIKRTLCSKNNTVKGNYMNAIEDLGPKSKPRKFPSKIQIRSINMSDLSPKDRAIIKKGLDDVKAKRETELRSIILVVLRLKLLILL